MKVFNKGQQWDLISVLQCQCCCWMENGLEGGKTQSGEAH